MAGAELDLSSLTLTQLVARSRLVMASMEVAASDDEWREIWQRDAVPIDREIDRRLRFTTHKRGPVRFPVCTWGRQGEPPPGDGAGSSTGAGVRSVVRPPGSRRHASRSLHARPFGKRSLRGAVRSFRSWPVSLRRKIRAPYGQPPASSSEAPETGQRR